MEYKHSEEMSQEMIWGNLRRAQVHSIISACVTYSVGLKMLAEGMFARRKFIETKGEGGCVRIAEEYAVSLIIKYRHSCLVAIIQTLSIECLRAMPLCKR